MMANFCNKLRECVKAYTIFIISMVASAGAYIMITGVQVEYGKPNSLDCNYAVVLYERICILIFIAAIIGIFLLSFESGAKYGAMFYFLLQFIILVFCLIAWVRSLIWLSSSPSDQAIDMQNRSVELFDNSKAFTKHMEKIQQEKKCCGVNNYTDWIKILSQRRAPDSCCVNPTKNRKCGLKAFLELDSLVAAPNDEGDFVINVRTQAHFFNSSLQVPINFDITNTEVTTLNISVMSSSLDAEIEFSKTHFTILNMTSACDPKIPFQPIFFYQKSDFNIPREDYFINVTGNHTYSFRVLSTRELCHGIRSPNLTENGQIISNISAKENEEFEKWSFDNRGVIYVNGCGPHLKKHIDVVCGILAGFTPILMGLVSTMMWLYHHYYWKYRKVQILTNEKPGFWFEKLNKDDNAQVLGIASPSSLESILIKKEKRQKEFIRKREVNVDRKEASLDLPTITSTFYTASTTSEEQEAQGPLLRTDKARGKRSILRNTERGKRNKVSPSPREEIQ